MTLVEKLKYRVEETMKKLDYMEDRLCRLTPTKPSVEDNLRYDNSKKELVHNYSFYCKYCGERIRAHSKKHKCGQVHDWSFLEVDSHK